MLDACFQGLEKTDWSGNGRSLRLCSERSETKDQVPLRPPEKYFILYLIQCNINNLGY